MTFLKNKKFLSFAFLVFLSLISFSAFAQPVNDNCSGAINLCAGIKLSTNNLNGNFETDFNTNCFGLNSTVWYSFTTNNTGGNVTITIDNIVGMNGNDTLQGLLLSTSNPCSSFSEIDCEPTGKTSFALQGNNLSPNKKYWILIDGKLGNAPVAAEGTFDIEVSGPGVDINVSATTSTAECSKNNGSITVTASPSSPNYQYQLNNGAFQSSNIFSDLSSGQYNVQVKNTADGCIYEVSPDPIVPLIPGISSYVATTADAQCNIPDGSITISGLTGGTPPYTYTLNGATPQSNSTFSSLIAGNYVVTITDSRGCDTTFYTSVASDGGITSAQAQATNSVCGQNNGTITISNVTGELPAYYTLMPGSLKQTSNVFQNLGPNTYQVVIKGNDSCSYTVFAISIIDENNLTAETSTSNVVCGSSLGSITVTPQGGNSPYEYSLNGNSQTSNTFEGLSVGQYDLIVTDNEGCIYNTSVAISGGVIPCDAGEDQTIITGETTSLNAVTPIGSLTLWSPSATLENPELPQTNASPAVTTTYTLLVTLDGCVCEDEVVITVKPRIVPIPNTFTPNDDGINDVWRVPNLEYYDECTVDVYTRWGEKVFHSDGYEIGQEWNGTNHGLSLPAATYYYVIILGFESEQVPNEYGGFVTIIK